jgi:hypothetical protein
MFAMIVFPLGMVCEEIFVACLIPNVFLGFNHVIFMGGFTGGGGVNPPRISLTPLESL